MGMHSTQLFSETLFVLSLCCCMGLCRFGWRFMVSQRVASQSAFQSSWLSRSGLRRKLTRSWCIISSSLHSISTRIISAHHFYFTHSDASTDRTWLRVWCFHFTLRVRSHTQLVSTRFLHRLMIHRLSYRRSFSSYYVMMTQFMSRIDTFWSFTRHHN